MFELFRSFYLFSTGNYQKALETYKDIHRKFPENVECNSFYFQHRIILILLIIINWWEMWRKYKPVCVQVWDSWWDCAQTWGWRRSRTTPPSWRRWRRWRRSESRYHLCFNASGHLEILFFNVMLHFNHHLLHTDPDSPHRHRQGIKRFPGGSVLGQTRHTHIHTGSRVFGF